MAGLKTSFEDPCKRGGLLVEMLVGQTEFALVFCNGGFAAVPPRVLNLDD